MYIRNVTYGRKFENRKKLCDGEKPDDTEAPEKDCLMEDGIPSLLLKTLCQGKAKCEGKIPSIPIDETCDAMKREVRLEFICGK